MIETLKQFQVWMTKMEDPRTSQWFLISSPVPLMIICVAYLTLCIYGPSFMARRKPFQLRSCMMVYNTFEIILSGYMLYEFVITAWLQDFNLRCQAVDYSRSENAIRMARVCWLYFFSKVIELLDTVFIVLRKKNEQISFLHVFHHSTMMWNWWLAAKFVPGGDSIICATLNCFIHVIMYTYYLLSMLGPKIQPYLWWKRYLTQLQMLQFLLFSVHSLNAYFMDCRFPKMYNLACLIYGFILISLFANFYLKSYIQRNSQKHHRRNVEENKEIICTRTDNVSNGNEKYLHQNGFHYKDS